MSTGKQLPEVPRLKKKVYEAELARLQIELVKLQEWIKAKGLRVIVIFEGRDAAGKGGTIKRITETLNPRACRVVALGTSTKREKTQWYFQRYMPHLPAAGEMVLFDRSCYNRADVERVMGFCSDADHEELLRSCPELERRLMASAYEVNPNGYQALHPSVSPFLPLHLSDSIHVGGSAGSVPWRSRPTGGAWGSSPGRSSCATHARVSCWGA